MLIMLTVQLLVLIWKINEFSVDFFKILVYTEKEIKSIEMLIWLFLQKMLKIIMAENVKSFYAIGFYWYYKKKWFIKSDFSVKLFLLRNIILHFLII